MYLQQHARSAAFALQSTVNVKHRDLDEIGSGALDLHVDRFAFRLIAVLVTRRWPHPFDLAPSSQDRADIALFAARLQQALLVFLHVGIFIEIGVDERGSVL